MKKISLLFVLSFSLLVAQENVHRCYTTEYMDILEQNNPGIKDGAKQLFDLAQAHAQQNRSLKATNAEPDTIYRIPVVFHVVYNGSAQNTDYSLLESQIQVLNEDYRRMNADTSNTRSVFKDRAGDVGFEFFFATIDPDGNPTNGVTRTPTTSTFSFFNLDAMKSSSTGGKDAWDTDKYLNIWVCDLGGAVLGFAYPPTAAPNWPTGQGAGSSGEEGVVIHYEVIGYNNPLASGQLSIADRGRTAVHEVGHFWGLRHIWGDSGNPFTGAPDCDITADDGFSDTPHMGNNSQTTGCSFSKNTCTNGESPDEPDMVENYMDYSTEACQNMFTQEQADLMQSMAVIGRPNLVHVIQDEVISLNPGDWIVVNGTDTFQIGSGSSIQIVTGDEIVFLNQNNGFGYTAAGGITLTGAGSAALTADGNATITAVFTSIRDVIHSKLSVFPNPTKDLFTIQHQLEDQDLILEVHNQVGQLVMTQKLKGNHQQFSTENLSNGVYFVNIRNHSSVVGVSKLHVLK